MTSNISFRNSQDIRFRSHRQLKPFPLHTHDFLEIFVITKGNCVHFHNNRYELLVPGSFTIIKPKESHSFLETNNLNVLNISFFTEYWINKNELFITYLKKLEQSLNEAFGTISLSGQIFFKILDLVAWAKQEQNSLIYGDNAEKNLIISTIVTQIFIIVVHNKNNKQIKPLNYLKEQNGSTMLHNIVDLIFLYRSSYDNINLSEYVKSKKISYDTFYKHFRQYVSLSPKQVELKLKLFKARNIMINNPELTVTEVANISRFYDISSFYKHFTKEFSITPKKFINLNPNK